MYQKLYQLQFIDMPEMNGNGTRMAAQTMVVAAEEE
jgi:hypothetical protein